MSVKRVYKTATAEAAEGGFAVMLDGRTVRTPKRNKLVLPSRALAENLCGEWLAQGDSVMPASMPLNRLAYTAIDLVREQHLVVASEIATYGHTDLLCYWAEEPDELRLRQIKAWQPWLDWAAETLNCRLATTQGINAVRQDSAVLDRLKSEVLNHDSFRLTGLHQAVTVTGSLILGLALSRAALKAEDAFGLAQIDETFQIERWGKDAAAAARHDRLKRDLLAVERYFGCL